MHVRNSTATACRVQRRRVEYSTVSRSTVVRQETTTKHAPFGNTRGAVGADGWVLIPNAEGGEASSLEAALYYDFNSANHCAEFLHDSSLH